MAGVKISAQTDGGIILGTDSLPVARSGTARRTILDGAVIKETRVTANTGSAYTVNAATAQYFDLTLTANTTITASATLASVEERKVFLKLTQDGTGSRTLAWSGVTWDTGTAPVMPTTATTGTLCVSLVYTSSEIRGFVGGQSPLTNTHILVGNTSGLAADVAMSGDATIANTGAVTVATIGGLTPVTTAATQTLTNKTITQTVNAQTGTTYTFVAADFRGTVTASNASAQTYTLPQQSTLTTTAGVGVWLENIGSGTITLVKEGSETLTGNSILLPNTKAFIFRDTTTDWFVFGGTATVNLFGTHVDVGAITTSNTIVLVGYVGVASTLLGIYQKARALTTAGTFAIKKNGTSLSGLATVTPSTAGGYTTATGTGSDNVLARGDQITIVADGTLLGVLDLGISLDLTQAF